MNTIEFFELEELYQKPENFLENYFGDLRSKVENEFKDKLEVNSNLIKFINSYQAKPKKK